MRIKIKELRKGYDDVCNSCIYKGKRGFDSYCFGCKWHTKTDLFVEGERETERKRRGLIR